DPHPVVCCHRPPPTLSHFNSAFLQVHSPDQTPHKHRRQLAIFSLSWSPDDPRPLILDHSFSVAHSRSLAEGDSRQPPGTVGVPFGATDF
ncbi:hypothetical protein OAG51_03280, partial [Pirellulaceae bacterium]|nr:hypothetical protein [Pirellulaceae bacterium]